MWRRLEAGGERRTVTIAFEGTAVAAREGDSVAAAILAAIGAAPTRTTPVGGAPRAPYCLMGVCFECLVEIDGRPNRQACMTPVRDGMRVRRQGGARDVLADAAAAGAAE